jgi:glyoxylase I family protein
VVPHRARLDAGPSGAQFDTPARRRYNPAMTNTNKILNGGGFHHVALRVRDFDRSVAFYRDILGCAVRITWGDKPGRGALLDTGDGNYMELFERPNEKPIVDEGPVLHFAFRTTDVDGVTARARSAGYEVTVEPKDHVIPSHELGGVKIRISFFRGPDGEQVELFANTQT